jgi:hypothetical protein
MDTYHSRSETPVTAEKEYLSEITRNTHRTLSNCGSSHAIRQALGSRTISHGTDYGFIPRDYKVFIYLYKCSLNISIPHAASFATRITANLVFIH